MKVFASKLGLLLLLGIGAAAQTDAPAPAVLKDIQVSEINGHSQIELLLTAPVNISTTTATHPDRLIIDLPNTIDASLLQKMQIESGGVRTIDLVHSLDPEDTKVVVELDRPLNYEMNTADGHLNFLFLPVAKPSEGAPGAATRGTLAGLFHHDKNPVSTKTEASHNTPAAATGGTLAGQQIYQPPTSGPVQKLPDTAPQSNGVAGTDRAPATSVEQTASSAPVPALKDAPETNHNVATTDQNAQVPAAPAPLAAQNGQQQTTNQNPSAEGTDALPAPKSQLSQIAPASEKSPITAESSKQAPTVPQPPADAAENSKSGSGEDAATATLTAQKSPAPQLVMRAADPSLRTVFRVKYVAEGIAYLDGGRNAGLKEGVKLEIRNADNTATDGTSVAPSDPRVVAQLEVSAVAESSAVSDVQNAKRPVKVGDLAYLSTADADALIQATALSPTRKYPAVVSFTEGDPEDDDIRAEAPKPPLPSVNRARGRFGFDYMGTVSHGTSSVSSSALGLMFRGDLTRIGGTYWNLSGFWRGRLTSESSSGQQTLQDLINRTYHLSMTYANPDSNWVAGFGRLYLPWASSLDTIDGGYVGRKVSDTATVGIFAGSTPDPTSYDYAPDRAIGGSFINFTGGDFQKVHYSSTIGAGLSMISWKLDRPFGFLENSLSFSQRVSMYDALQVDSPAGNPAVPSPGPGLSRNFFTLRFQITKRLELDGNDTYFRDIPTFDPALIGTGLLDKYLFQGFSAGGRFEFVKNGTVYAQLGRSSRTGDASASLNQLYGVTFSRLPLWALRADFHYAEFNSSFGSGKYKAFSLGRNLTDAVQADVLVGQQSFAGPTTSTGRTWFVMSNTEMNLGSRYFVEGSITTNRGQMSYDQWMFTLGYRFDSRGHKQ